MNNTKIHVVKGRSSRLGERKEGKGQKENQIMYDHLLVRGLS